MCYQSMLFAPRRVNNVVPKHGHGTMPTTWYDSLMPRYFYDVVLTTRDNNNKMAPYSCHDVVQITRGNNNETTPCYYYDVVKTTRHHKVLVSSLPPLPPSVKETSRSRWSRLLFDSYYFDLLLDSFDKRLLKVRSILLLRSCQGIPSKLVV